ncbi:MAG TPA: FecR domain-containing protein [Gemmataceae bacterium]|jgi:ferric-dicitrate binding protein FerR (iron transport regulator)|nr:FecR domain-containing protein [Gemmataceae bacterium]
MSEPQNVPQRLQDLTDDYLSGLLDEAGVGELEGLLRADAEARRYFVCYAALHTDLHLEARARQAAEGALKMVSVHISGKRKNELTPFFRKAALAAGVLLALAAGWWLVTGRAPAVAWLVNAQNCKWADDVAPAGDLRAGTVLALERGLAEVRFACGARAVLEGPARLELLSGKSARLVRGKLTARAAGPAAGFEVLSPQGQFIDRGTEFGVAVSEGGATEVYVFEGRVEARPADAPRADTVSLARDQAARIDAGKITLTPQADGGGFVRQIVPPPVIVPRSLRLAFDRAADNGLRDGVGQGVGLTHRLPGTGGALPERDPNLRLDPARGRLELTTTNSDLNRQFQLPHGEYLGVRLSDLGFTGAEDFAVTATVPDIPALEFVGQFGLYAGAAGDRNIRGGLLSARRDAAGQYTQFLVNNHQGRDRDIHRVGLLSTGADLRFTLKRTGGKYALTVANLTAGSSSTLAIRHPDFLDGRRDLYVGLFGANTQSPVRKTLTVKDFSVTVWAVEPARKE